MDNRLDALAAALPADLEPKWIAEVVRAFGCARGLGEENDLLDYWQEAVAVAIEKSNLAVALGRDPVAYLKRGVRFYLIGLNRKLDIRRAAVTTFAAKADEEEEEATQGPTIEDFDHSAFDSRESLELRRLDDARVALYATISLSPELAAYWRAYRETDGSDSKVGARLGVYRKTVAKYHRRIFFERFKANYLAVRKIRGKAA